MTVFIRKERPRVKKSLIIEIGYRPEAEGLPILAEELALLASILPELIQSIEEFEDMETQERETALL